MGESSNGQSSRSKARFSVLGDRNGTAAPAAPERQGSSGSGGRGRGRRRRKKQPKGPPLNPQLHDPDAKSARRRRRRGRRGRGRPGEGPPVAEPRPAGNAAPQAGASGDIDAFALFAAYHLGISEEGTYRPSNIHDVARRFGTSAGGIRQALTTLGMDSDSVINSDFDMAMAQYDIQVAPEGVNVLELARNLYREFREASPNARDWERELAEDAAANARTFGNED